MTTSSTTTVAVTTTTTTTTGSTTTTEAPDILTVSLVLKFKMEAEASLTVKFTLNSPLNKLIILKNRLASELEVSRILRNQLESESVSGSFTAELVISNTLLSAEHGRGYGVYFFDKGHSAHLTTTTTT